MPHLRRGWREAIAVQNRELIHRRPPRVGGPLPCRRDIPQHEPQQCGGGVIIRTVTARLDDLTELRMHALEVTENA